MEDNLSYLLSAIELAANIETGNATANNCENAILRQQPKWQKYLEQQNQLLQEAIKVFKNYDKSGDLKYFWQTLKTNNPQFNEGVFNQLAQHALSAYERGTLEDAYKMFCFISAYYPNRYNIYIYLGSTIQSLYGFEEAATFFKSISAIFPEPDLLFLAAENEMQRENTSAAREYLLNAQEAIAKHSPLSEYEEGLKVRIEELLKLFNT